ncbi:metallophosphoesterase [uncultured Paraglaciecola sp.]|uniref:metallophosphoesterase family protein n=1 Tax=uncultured Paraglaciecola sp. TaxID=1765024 RepID=UPI002597FDD9|nr:metallophosphoesterase [uncultured Paraglaciecola sp.]
MRMLKKVISLLVIQFCFVIPITTYGATPPKQSIKIAFLADIHLHDIYADIELPSDQDHDLFPRDKDKKTLLMRSMSSQLKSTRLFNENYFVLTAALDDIVARNIKLVALPGDFTDDGQPINVLAVKAILDRYSRDHDIQFFVITGNHDPVRPFSVAGGKSDFLLQNGEEAGIYSLNHSKCKTQSDNQKQVYCSKDIQHWGYQEIMESLAHHGFMPKADYVYYETPFTQSNGNPDKDHSMQKRYLDWCSDDQPKLCYKMPDASYLVEPIDGLWVLAIDANVYVIDDNDNHKFKGSSNAGYNAMFRYKKPVLDWIESVVTRAKQSNKQLVAFSHFPMTDFYDGASDKMRALFGNNTFQMKRLPTAQTENLLANTGLQLHFAGHMHINDTGSAKSDSGSTLYNIQVPSLAAYQPAYKLLTLSAANIAEIETVTVNKVPKFDTLFTHYQTEWHFNHSHKLPNWDQDILAVSSYAEFTDKHLQGVITNRYLPKEWPQDLVSFLENNSLSTLLALNSCAPLDNLANQAYKSIAANNALTLIYDFYRIKNADHIAAINANKKRFYLYLNQAYENCEVADNQLFTQLQKLLSTLALMLQSEPSANFIIDLNTHTLTNKTEKTQ